MIYEITTCWKCGTGTVTKHVSFLRVAKLVWVSCDNCKEPASTDYKNATVALERA